jgi:sugar/nucleoside kinase (ribokinase family)
LARHFPQ